MKKINYRQHYNAALLSMFAYWIRIVFDKNNKPSFDIEKNDTSEKQKHKVRNYLNKIHFKNVRFIDNRKSESQILCAMKSGVAYIAYRGTTNKKDWKINATIKPVSSFMGEVHSGYLKSVKSTMSKVEKYLKDYLVKKVIVCGHSKGAGECTISFAYIKAFLKKYNVIGGVNFGSPRVMKKAASIAFNKKYKDIFYRYVNNNDVVCKLPPPGFILKARHVDTKMYIDRKGNIRRTIKGLRRFWDGIAGRFADIGNRQLDGIGDHYPHHYIKAIKKKL